MRLQELILKVRDDELRLRFHPRLTVVAGLGHVERRQLAGAIADGLLGGDQTSQITYVDDSGRRVRAMCSGGRLFAEYEGGAAAPSPLAAIGQRSGPVRDILVPAAVVPDVPDSSVADPEVEAARATLVELDEQVRAARAQQSLAEELRCEIRSSSRQIEQARRDADRREYVRVVRELEKVRLEWMAVSGQVSDDHDSDARLLLSADRARRLAERCLDARARASSLLAALGGAAEVRPSDLAAVDVPERAPAHLEPLLGRWARAAEHRNRIHARLAELVRQAPPAPSEAAVARLATIKPTELRLALDRALAARAALERAKVELGGAEVDDRTVATPVERVEAAHAVVLSAQEHRDRLRPRGVGTASSLLLVSVLLLLLHPLAALVVATASGTVAAFTVLRPLQRLRHAVQEEQQCLEDVDAASYLGFHLRRVEATVDPGLSDRARQAVHDHRAAVAGWRNLTGDAVSPERAAVLMDEVAAFRSAVQEQGGMVARARTLRHQLEHEVEPVLRSIWHQLGAACAKYRIDPAELEHGPRRFAQLVARQVQLGQRVRNVIRLRQAQETERAAVMELETLFVVLGVAGSGVRSRMRSLEQLAVAALEREAARRSRRNPGEVQSDLTRLQRREEELRRPEFESNPPTEDEVIDLDDVEQRLEELRDRLERSERASREANRLWERREAMIRRVSALTGSGRGTTAEGVGAELYERVAALLAAAAAGEQGATIPVVLDEPLELVAVERRWDLLEFVLRASDRHQVVYLTGDPFVAAWAREPRHRGLLDLVEAGSDPEIAVNRNLGHAVISSSSSR
jgi:hypothetical protein